jgi:DNA-binding MarR family transcriptional regulator
MYQRAELVSLGGLVKYADSLISIVLEPALSERGFSYVQYLVLLRVRLGTAINPKEIAAQIRYDSGALTRVVDQLVDRGLLERVRSDRDRRKVELLLTPAGSRTTDRLIERITHTMTRALVDFSDSEVRTLGRLLMKLTTALR